MKNVINYFVVFAFLLVGCSNDEESVSLPNPVPQAQDCPTTHSLVGESRELRRSSQYGISGTVTIVSDCEIEISNFFYNGLGPAVSVYGGNNSNFVDGISLSEPIQGRRFEGETLTVFLPENITLDEINSFSIWCFRFDIDFSSASFQ